MTCMGRTVSIWGRWCDWGDLGMLTLRIESLAYGIFGVARAEGGVVFVPGTAPGDVVRARVVKEQPGYREAELVEIVERSTVRRTPPCPYVSECGGCGW